MYNLTFEFNIEKLVQSIAYFSNFGIRDLTKLKVAKLLYFADKEHLLEYGQPIIGDVYFCLDYGPAPSVSLNEMALAISGSEVSSSAGSDENLFTEVLRVKKFFHRYPRFEVKEAAYKPEIFSQTETSSLRHTANIYGDKSAGELVNLTHLEPTWVIANHGRLPGGRRLITYDLFFQGASEKSQRFLAKLVAEQFGAAIPLAGDADYMTFASELASHNLAPDEMPESDVQGTARFSRA
jgi:uncharacterized phage-associated protein